MDQPSLEAMFRELLAMPEEARQAGLAKVEQSDAALAAELRQLFALLPEAERWFSRLETSRS